MKHKILWLIVIIFPVIIFFLLSFKTIKEITTYLSLNQKTKAFIENFEIKKERKNQYKATVCYSYRVNDKIFKNKSNYNKPFLNYMNASDYMEKKSKSDLYIWFNKKKPNIASLERTFPIKNCIYLIITFLVFVYFLILKYYVYSFQKSD